MNSFCTAVQSMLKLLRFGFFSTQTNHFYIYFYLTEQWKNKTRNAFLVKCPWTKWALFHTRKNGCRSYFVIVAHVTILGFTADQLTIDGDSLEIILSSASPVFPCLLPMYTFQHFPSLPHSCFVGTSLPSVLQLKSRCGLNLMLIRILTEVITAGPFQGAPGSEIINLLPLCFANSFAAPQPGLTCIGKGCLHTKGLNCFGCLQRSILH